MHLKKWIKWKNSIIICKLSKLNTDLKNFKLWKMFTSFYAKLENKLCACLLLTFVLPLGSFWDVAWTLPINVQLIYNFGNTIHKAFIYVYQQTLVHKTSFFVKDRCSVTHLDSFVLLAILNLFQFICFK